MSSPSPETTRTNRLAATTSPYLLQHATNPVDWWPWGPEALAEAQRTGKPILLSIGYAACHWCHVMAHESFEDEATAGVMNALFVNIKVDREERPDIDHIYMSALHQLGEQGGWPLTMFLTPEGVPFWGGTYFPKQARFGRPSFVDVLESIAQTYASAPDKIAHNRDALLARLSARHEARNPAQIGVSHLDNLAASICDATDPVHGGLRVAPKFPQCPMLEFLWRAGARSGERRFFAATELALTEMSRGGIYDHLGGGYARYSVDAIWLVPHFEKMLYDNAQILELLALEAARNENGLMRQRAIETVDWLLRDMTTGEGAFASSLDADSEGEEGRFYVWTPVEIEAVIGPENAALFAQHYGVSEGGNFEGRNILNQLNALPITPETGQQLAGWREMLRHARSKRIWPGRDDKVLADWNGLMIAALALASGMLRIPAWLDHARRAYDFVATRLVRDGRLGHAWRAERLTFPGMASDYAAMIRAALALFEMTGEARYRDDALRWQHDLDRHYADRDHDQAHGGYFLTADDADGLIVRPHVMQDDAVPNYHGLIVANLLRLSAVTGDDRRRQQADQLLDYLLRQTADNLFAHLSILNALDLRLSLRQIVIAGSGAKAEALIEAARALPSLSRVVIRAASATDLPAGHPARDWIAQATEPAAYLCRGNVCELPIIDPDKLTERFFALQSA